MLKFGKRDCLLNYFQLSSFIRGEGLSLVPLPPMGFPFLLRCFKPQKLKVKTNLGGIFLLGKRRAKAKWLGWFGSV